MRIKQNTTYTNDRSTAQVTGRGQLKKAEEYAHTSVVPAVSLNAAEKGVLLRGSQLQPTTLIETRANRRAE